MGLARRAFLIGSAAVVGGVAFGTYALRREPDNPLRADAGEAILNPYVIIDAEGVTVITPRAEMGQGIHTTLAALVAEEMDLDLAQVRTLHGPAADAYANRAIAELGAPFAGYVESRAKAAVETLMEAGSRLFFPMQVTGGSTSTVDAFDRMRAAGASARATLVRAAADRLGVPPAALRTEGGAVIGPDGPIPYPDLAEAAASLDPVEAEPKDRADWRILGRSQPRVDMAAKCTGTAIYSGDVRLPGMRFAAVRRNPHLGAAMLDMESDGALAVPGVDQVVRLADGFAVVAANSWAAMRGAEAVVPRWEAAPYPADTDAILAEIERAFDADPQSALRDDGDAGAAGQIEARYAVPYLAHATMEPVGATALYADGRLTVWAGNQAPTVVRDAAAKASGLEAEAVEVVTTYMGGGFGRRAETDFILPAIECAMAMEGVPVQAFFSREEDMTHDVYRPAVLARLKGSVEGSRVSLLSCDVAGSSVFRQQAVRVAGFAPPGTDKLLVEGAFDQPYGIESYRVRGHISDMAIPVGSWRSVGNSHNAFFLEGFMDELAHHGGLDPVAMRLDLMREEDPASAACLEAVAEMSDWGSGAAKGVAFCFSFGSPTAQVVQVSESGNGVRIDKVWCAIDVGLALDPSIIEAQVQSGIVYGLSAAMTGEITFAEGRVVETNFDSYAPLRLHQCPEIEVRVLQSGVRMGGVGEPGLPPVAPALANALFALTGERHRELPLSKAVRFA